MSRRPGLAGEAACCAMLWPTMRLQDIAGLLRPIEVRGLAPGEDTIEVTDLAYDSRRTTPGSLFFCLPGERDDGHRHAADAVRAGAAAVVCQRPLAVDVPQLVVEGARAAMNRLAAPFFGNPSRSLALAGVTGTNGKTTITYLLDAISTATGAATGLIGTVETRLPGASGTTSEKGVRTTPESVDLQRLLRRMVDAGVGFCAMEVTSIGLSQGRVDGTAFRAALFTNLTQDHLDYHGDLESYYRTKRRLFLPGRAALALVNADDPYGARLASELGAEGTIPLVTFGLDADADVRAVDVTAAAGGSRFRVVGAGLDLGIRLRLPGRFNVSNALAAAATARALGVPADAIAEGLGALARVPGRFELVDEGQDFAVVVDYAHTPDSLTRVLSAARELGGAGPLRGDRAPGPGPGRVIAVFGCGGDRDRGKRPLMGRAAAEAADFVVVTSDNPRSEPPEAIIAEVAEGIVPGPPALGYRLVPDRAEAISEAITRARPGDVVVIAGKGHETTQSFSDRVVEFDDALVAAEALRRLASGRGRGKAPQRRVPASDGSR
jgi:UDP-N-acetylmuramoyl-L-alanyl-D-glutamate--2,6-diaminopimelate ligase